MTDSVINDGLATPRSMRLTSVRSTSALSAISSWDNCLEIRRALRCLPSANETGFELRSFSVTLAGVIGRGTAPFGMMDRRGDVLIGAESAWLRHLLPRNTCFEAYNPQRVNFTPSACPPLASTGKGIVTMASPFPTGKAVKLPASIARTLALRPTTPPSHRPAACEVGAQVRALRLAAGSRVARLQPLPAFLHPCCLASSGAWCLPRLIPSIA